MTLGPGENSDGIARRVVGRPFVKGQTANPGGRPKGLAEYVRGQTAEGKELADFHLAILRRTGEFEGARLPLGVRMEAANWLAERAFGKVAQPLEHGGPGGGPIQSESVVGIEVRAVDYRLAATPLRPLLSAPDTDE